MARREVPKGGGSGKGGSSGTTSSIQKRQIGQTVLQKEFIGSGSRVSDIADVIRKEKRDSQNNKQQRADRTNKVKIFPNLGGTTNASMLFDSRLGGTLKDIVFNNKHTDIVLLTVVISTEAPETITNYPDVKNNADTSKFAYLVFSAIIPNKPSDTAITTKSAGRENITTLSEICGLLNPLSSDGDPRNGFFIYGWTSVADKIDAIVLL